MTWEGWVTLLIVGSVFVALFRNWAPADLLFISATSVLALLGIITPTEAFAGFSNAGMLTVAVLFVVAAALRETGVLDYLGHHVLGRAKTARGAMLRLAGAVVPFSAFLNNTPLVAMFVPVVLDWGRRNQVSPSRLLIPLSYFAILGGTCTLIGTSTNLVVNGLMLDAGLPGMSLFEISAVGIPYAIIGVVYMLTFGNKILPERKELLEQLSETRREYLLEMLVEPRCRFVGLTVEAAGLRNLPGLFLIEIARGQTILGPVSPDTVIQAGDRLVFTGIVSSIIELEKTPGLVPAADPGYQFSPQSQRNRRLCEAVISPSSPLVGRTIRGADFRTSYGAAVVAVHRGGSRIGTKVGDVRMQAGDTLLLQVQSHFTRAHRNDPAFYLVSNIDDWRPPRRDRMWVALLIFVLLLAMMTSNTVSVLIAAMLAGVLMVATGCISVGEARRSIEWQVLITIAAAFGVGTALEKSGAAAVVAGGLVGAINSWVPEAWGPIAALAAIYLLGSIMTEMITNNAAAVLLFPLCLQMASQYGIDSRPLVIALILAASASFMTPIGYQTNMIVYGPGGYRFSDFLRIGTPLSLMLTVVAVILIPLFWPFYR